MNEHLPDLPLVMDNIAREIRRRDDERYRLAVENQVLRSILGLEPKWPVAKIILDHVLITYFHHIGSDPWDTLLDTLMTVSRKMREGHPLTKEDMLSLEDWIPAITMDSTTMPDVVIFAFLETLSKIRSEVNHED